MNTVATINLPFTSQQEKNKDCFHQFSVAVFMEQMLMEHELCARFGAWGCKRLTMEAESGDNSHNCPRRQLRHARVLLGVGGGGWSSK